MAYALNETTTFRSRRRPIPEPRADQHDAPPTGSMRRSRRCRRSSTATWTRRAARSHAQLPAGRWRCNRRTSPTHVVGVEHHDRSSAAVADARRAVVCRPLRVAPRASAQHQPVAGGHDSAESGREHQRAAALSRIRQHHALRDDRHGRATTACRRRSSAASHARRRASASPTRSRGRRTTAAAAATSCRTPTTTAGTTASRISIARTCWCRRSAIASRRSSRRRRRCAGCSATGMSSGIFQAQSGAPFDVTTTVDVAGVGPAAARSSTTRSAIRPR